MLYVVLNWYFIIDSMIDTHGLHQTVWSGEMTIIRANDAWYDRAYKQHCGMIVMFKTIIQQFWVVYEQIVNEAQPGWLIVLAKQNEGFVILH